MGLFKSSATENTKLKEVVKDELLNNVVEGLIVADESGNIIYHNALGKSILDSGLFGPIDIVSKNPKEFEYEGHYYVASYEKISEKTGIKGVVATLTDTFGIREEKRLLDETKDKLEKANGFKSAFLANMSHEIRTPIHAIIGFAELINNENLPDKVKNDINLIKESSYGLLAIINDVLDLSKLEAGKMELVCSNYYISYIIRDLDATYSMLAGRKGLNFEVHLDENIPSNLFGDKIRIRGALINLLNNAIKYTKEGHIDLYIRVVEKKEGTVLLRFEVSDTGIGIKKEDQEKIFESFSRFDIENNYAVEGRGLGLSIAKGYVELMDGTLEVKSEYGVGSTFIMTIPQKIVDNSPVDMKIVNARKKGTRDKFTIKNCNVLVVDDNPVNLKVADGLMKSFGLTVDSASGGAKAIEACMKKEYDLIFMDQMMPEVDGPAAMKQIRKISKFYENESKILVLTADAMAGVRDRMMAEGFDEYLCKPLEMHRLEEMLRRFVPSGNIVEEKDTIVVVEANTPGEETEKQTEAQKEDEIGQLAQKLKINKENLEKKVRDCGGTLEDFREVCKIALKNFDSKIKKMREAQTTKDYDRYTIEVHALKSTLASLGATDIAEKAKEQENAGREGRREYIDENVESLIKEYEDYLELIKLHVLGIDDSDIRAKKEGRGEEWSKDEIVQVAEKLSILAAEYNFGEIFDIIEKVKNMEKGPETKSIFDKMEDHMNNMDIDGLKEQLEEIMR